MFSPSTPRSTHSASSAGNSPNILTPGQKIKAMMAEFDSSEDDVQPTKPLRSIWKPDFESKPSTASETRQQSQTDESANESDDADDIARPKGRMAARMQGDAGNAENKQDTAFSRLSKALRNEREQTSKRRQESLTPAGDSSDDELPAAGLRRRNGKSRQSPTPVIEPRSSPNRARSASPLFASLPAASRDGPGHDASDNEQAEDKPRSNSRFLALVAQKRKEREEREKIEAEQKAARQAQMAQFSSEILSGEESEADDPGSATRLSQKARQPRKASKKALEEMSRETQRMSRNMQLAHQAQTKKKITKESFFARFNFMQPDAPVEPTAANSSSAAGSQNSSDGEGAHRNHDTPHTSPVLGPSDAGKPASIEDSTQAQSQIDGIDYGTGEADLPPLNAVTSTTHRQEVSAVPSLSDTTQVKKDIARPKNRTQPLTGPPVRVLLAREQIARHRQDDSDSDDLEIVTSPAKCRRIAAFENVTSKKMTESSSMTKLKLLAHLTSPTRKMSSMTSAELSASLLHRARQQAAKERRERIEELRAKGVVIETAEERAAMEDDVEDLVEKARQEADEIARQERAAKRKAQGLDDDEEDDADYALSGSDEDASGEEEDDNEDSESINGNQGFVEREADEGDDSEDEQSEDAISDTEGQVSSSRRKRRARVVSDDEDEDEQPQVPSTPVRPPSNAPRSARRPHFPGMESPSNLSMGLTQAFAGTMADDDSGSQIGPATVPFSLPDPGPPVPMLRAQSSEILVRDSQDQNNEHNFLSGHNQNIARVSESPATHHFSQYSQLPDPTQDEGFVFSPFDPAKRFRGTPPVSTVDTVLVGQGQSPVGVRRNKQLRRGRAANLPVVEENADEDGFEVNANAFNVMKKASKKPVIPYDRKQSKAKNIVDEAAEESEDEYAGIGGASDDSEGEEDAYDQQMINDQSGEAVDEKELAALNAVHQRNRDEKDVAKLLKDLTTGALRRRRGADDDLDLDDSDEERLARRREKQREFAKMRRALLADAKIGELAENPKKAAFFKAIEDRDMEDDFELDFLEEKEAGSQGESSQDVTTEEQVDSAEDSKKRKRPLEPAAEDTTNRPPPHLRRTPTSAMSKKPATLAEIRETLSFLTETPEYDSFHEDASLDEEAAEEGDDSNPFDEEAAHSEDADSRSKDGFAVPRHPRRTRAPVVDRLALLRQASSNSATGTASGSTNTKMAFHSGGHSDSAVGFRPPQLLRRVTSSSSSSNSSTTSSSSNRVTKPAASGPKKGGSVNSYTAARERERERQLRKNQRGGSANIAKLLNKHAGNGLGALAGKGSWD